MKKMLSSINTLYLVYLEDKALIYTSNECSETNLNVYISRCAGKIAKKRKFTYAQWSDLTIATKFFIEKWRNDE